MVCKLYKYKERSTRRRKWKKKGVEKKEIGNGRNEGGKRQVLKKDFELQPEIIISLAVTIDQQVYAVQSALNFIKIQNQNVLYT